MAAASSSNAPVGGESASDEESVRSDDQHSAVRAAAGSIRTRSLVSAARVEKQAEATHQTRMTTVPLLASSTFDPAPKVSILYGV